MKAPTNYSMRLTNLMTTFRKYLYTQNLSTP